MITKFILEKPEVDNRVELLSIVFRLAECREYCNKRFKIYVDTIEKHFSPYKNHELIKFIKELREKTGVAYDAAMSMAVHLDKEANFEPLVPFSDDIPDIRWGKENAYKFIELLKKFYSDADCETFFKISESLYKESNDRISKVSNSLDVKWYTKFYGKEPKEKFIIIPGLGIGVCNYGPRIQFENGEKYVYAIMGTWGALDSLGFPDYEDKRSLPIIVHELNHTFINYLIYEKHRNDFMNSGEKINDVVGEIMKIHAFGKWELMIIESLVRAAVIKYMKDHNFENSEVENEINKETKNGFYWISELVDELDNYSRNRKKYPSLESYMTNIVNAFNDYAKNILIYENNVKDKLPKVVSINEFTNGDNNVDAEIKTITLNFDQELFGKGDTINYGNKEGKYCPEIGEITYSKDNKSVIMEVKLEKGKEYHFDLTGLVFKSKYSISYEINFITEK